jgi:hypothetical protein
MTAYDWRPLAGVDFHRLYDARLQAHYAAQWLARAARAYIASKPDDGHTNLGWDEAFGGFATHKMQGARVGLKLFPLSIAILEPGESTPSRILGLDGHKEADLRAWLGEEMGSLGLDARKLDLELPYRMPVSKVASGTAYAVNGKDEIFRELAAWFANADRSIGRVAEGMRAMKFEVSAVRCWPHHFDLAALISLDSGTGTLESARTVGIGLSPGDHYYNEPYFYVTPWPYPEASKLPPLSDLGRWHMKDFTAAVAPAHRILAMPGRQTETEKFLAEAVAASIKALA